MGVGQPQGRVLPHLAERAGRRDDEPDPAVCLEAACRLGVKPARLAVVEDALAGVEFWRRRGFGLLIEVERSDRAEAPRSRGADVVIGDLSAFRKGATEGVDR
jgi:beta-phosphoglucomutase-like phosphatase (HAD superfamily)